MESKLSQNATFQSPPPPHLSNTSFPILAIALIGIVATAFLLLSYYIFVIKCCLNWHRIDILRRFSLSRRRHDPAVIHYSPPLPRRGLDESVIQSIPIFQFKRSFSLDSNQKSFYECSVCLNEFQEDEKLRILQNCSHVFHIDCIDTWLQSNANCPLCRSAISSTIRFPHADQIVAPSSSPQDLNNDENYVVIELGDENSDDQSLLGRQERSISGELSVSASVPSISPSPIVIGRKLNHVSSMGDECIDTRGKDEQFSVQPIRRSFSMDSSADRQMYLSIREIVQQRNRNNGEVSSSEDRGSRVRRSFFSFGHSRRGSRSAVLPVFLE